MKALPPANESDRLRVLREHAVLDTDTERSFDDIAQLASSLLQAPAAMITLVDESRQWFKASHGLAFRETHRDLSFCAHAILASDAMVVPDATLDARFRDNPLVTEAPGIRSYAGVPLITADGYALGTLAVVDFVSREFTPAQIHGLEALGRQVMVQLELRRCVVTRTERAIAAENRLDSAAQHHRVIFESALDAIVVMDADGRVVDLNAAAERLFGYTRLELSGRPMSETIIPPEYRAEHVRGLARYLNTGETSILGRRIEAAAMRRDGTRFPIELTVQRVGRGEPPHFVGFIRDITERTRATEELRASSERYRHQRRELTRLMQDERLYHGARPQALRQITDTVASTLSVPRVSVWQRMREQSLIRCLDLYDATTHLHSSGQELLASSAPTYFSALERLEVIAASDARQDPRTRELAEVYLQPHGISSLLDAPVHLHGSLHGVLRLEHVGATREWTADEETFALAAANLVSLAVEGDERRQAEEALITQTTILGAVSESLAAYVERNDWKQAFSRLLACALALTQSEYGFVGVLVEGEELRVLAHEGLVWDRARNREFYDAAMRHYEQHGYVTFRSFDNLFGLAVTTGDVVIANDPARDPRAKGLPAGHPPMTSFLGVPFRGPQGVAGVIALANRREGYGGEEASRIQALVQQGGALCESYRQRERARAHEEERKQAEAALRASDERLRLVARATNDAVWDWDLNTNAVFVPDGFGKLFGDKEDDVVVSRDTWYARVHPDDRERIGASLRGAIDDGADVWSDEYRFRRADGTYAHVFDRGYILRDDERRPVRMLGAMMDISERKQLEAQFWQSQKLEAVGQLAGGVAHDFNNMLTVIKGHASLLSDGNPSPEALESVQQIAEATERAAGLTRQLLAFSRKQVLQTTGLDVDEVVGRMLRLLERVLGEHIRLQVVPSVAGAFVRADATMMEQVVLNLALNARDAMPRGGRLTLTTTTERLDRAMLPDHPDARPGDFVKLSVSDSGSGIAADVLPHIFEPFFTTKGSERGTGLGLATVYGVVKQHLGWVTVQSAVGAGTTFQVYLPALKQAVAVAPTVTQTGLGQGGTETILIVEDEEPVRLLARVTLERSGYTVLEAATGPAALAVWEKRGGHIDLLITDMVMPDGVSGLDVAHQLLRERPHLRVILTSGYSVDLADRGLPQDRRVTFLAKPFSVHQFLHVVRSTLDASD